MCIFVWMWAWPIGRWPQPLVLSDLGSVGDQQEKVRKLIKPYCASLISAIALLLTLTLISQSPRNSPCMCSNFTGVGKVRPAGEVVPMGPERIFVTVHISITKITALKRNSEHWSAGIMVKRRWYTLSAFVLVAFIDMNRPPCSIQCFYTFMG